MSSLIWRNESEICLAVIFSQSLFFSIVIATRDRKNAAILQVSKENVALTSFRCESVR